MKKSLIALALSVLKPQMPEFEISLPVLAI